MTTAEKYVSGAYLFFLAIVLLYHAIYSAKIARFEREVAQIERRPGGRGDDAGT